MFLQNFLTAGNFRPERHVPRLGAPVRVSVSSPPIALAAARGRGARDALGVTAMRDRAALVALYRSTNGSAWRDATRWLSDEAPCSSDGVANWGSCSSSQCEDVAASDGLSYLDGSIACAGICCGSNGTVDAILLYDNGLDGSLPTELGLATALRYLDTRYTSLDGSLPTELGLATALRYLDTGYTSLQGSFPTELGLATALRYLDTGYTGLDGSLPTELGLATSLRILVTSSTSVSGFLPTELGLATGLRDLVTSSTTLSGVLPTQIGLTTALQYLSTGSTFMSGSLPTQLGNARAIQSLITYGTYISGSLPTQLCSLMALQALETSVTSISGCLPTQLGLATALQSLMMDTTSISGSIPSQIGLLAELQYLNTQIMPISGCLPTQLGRLTALQYLITGGATSISGSLPTQIGILAELKFLDLTNLSLSLPASPRAFLNFEAATAHCSGKPTLCYGLAPLSCTAFKGDNRPIFNAAHSCIDCSGQHWPYVLLILSLVLILVLAVGSLARLAIRNGTSPATLARWGGTASMLVQHVQAIGLIGYIDLAWPWTLTDLMAYVSFDFLDVPRLTCFFPPSEAPAGVPANPHEFTFNRIVCSSVLAILMSSALVVAAMHYAHRHEAADTLELILSVVFSVPLATSWRSLASLLGQSIDAAKASAIAQGIASQCNLQDPEDGSGCNWPATSNYSAFMKQLDENPRVLSSLASTGTTLGVTLVVVQLALATRCILNLLAFRRGVRMRTWHWGLRRWPIAPRRIATRCAHLRGHFAPHAVLWELVVWLRQVLLLGVGVGCRATIRVVNSGLTPASINTTPVLRAVARYGWASVALLVVGVMAWAQERTQPYALSIQNLLARWMYISNALLLLLGIAFTAVAQYDETSSAPALEGAVKWVLIVLVLLDIVLGCGSAAAILVLEWHAARSTTTVTEFDMSGLLLAAIEPIDGPLRECLKDGSIRLLRASWLADSAAGSVLRRRQELPEEAFFPCEEAAAMLDRGDRSILVVSHAWMTPSHPDPIGVTLTAMRHYIQEDQGRSACAVFVDYCSLPQKDSNGERSTREQATFSRGLGVMASMYASLTGTTVLIQRNVPRQADGGVGGEATVTAWNGRPYGERGWCSFESGVARMAAAHMRRVVSQLEQERRAAPDAVNRAEQRRPKVVDLSGEQTAEAADVPTGEPVALLRDVARLIDDAVFTNDADRTTVAHMLFALEWTMHVAIDEVLSRGVGRAGITFAPPRFARGLMRALTRSRISQEVGAAADDVQLLRRAVGSRGSAGRGSGHVMDVVS